MKKIFLITFINLIFFNANSQDININSVLTNIDFNKPLVELFNQNSSATEGINISPLFSNELSFKYRISKKIKNLCFGLRYQNHRFRIYQNFIKNNVINLRNIGVNFSGTMRILNLENSALYLGYEIGFKLPVQKRTAVLSENYSNFLKNVNGDTLVNNSINENMNVRSLSTISSRIFINYVIPLKKHSLYFEFSFFSNLKKSYELNYTSNLYDYKENKTNTFNFNSNKFNGSGFCFGISYRL